MRFLPLLCLMASALTAQNLSTTFAGGNSQSGNMFDLTGLQPVVISGFDVNLPPGSHDLAVYTVTGGGTFVGKEGNSAAWTLLGTATGVVSNGTGVATSLNLPVNTPIAVGQTQGFYVTVTSGGLVNYTNGTAIGNVFAQDANLQFREGVGIAYPFGATFAPRIWNGVIHYVPAAAQSLTTTFTSNNGLSGNMFDATALQRISVTGLDINLDPGTWNMQVYTVTDGTTFVGKETNAALWTLLGTTSVTSAALNVPTPVPLALGVLMEPGATRGFYVTATTGSPINYTNGTAVGNVYAQDAYLQIREGTGTGLPVFNAGIQTRIWNGTMRYVGIPVTTATNTNLGAACGYEFQSFYESFTPAGNAFDLNATAVKWTRAGGRYLFDTTTATFVTPSATATPVAPGLLDGEQAFTLSAAMPVLTGSTTVLNVCTKGYVGAGAGNPIDFTPSGVDLLAFPQTTWACWCDYDQRLVASGRILYEEIAGVAYVTWNGVYTFSGQVLPNTFQFQFRINTGDVTLVVVSANGPTVWPAVVGFSPGGVSLDPGSSDLSARVAGSGTILTALADNGLVLTAGNTPILGSSWNLTVGNIPVTGVIGVEVLGLGDPGINDLAAIGAPFCGLRASLDVLNPWIVAGATHAYGFAVPNNLQLMNVNVYTTTALFQTPAVNTFGAITSRGVQGKIGNN